MEMCIRDRPYTVQEVEAPKPYKVTAETTDVLILTGETEQKTITNKKVLPISVQLNAEKKMCIRDRYILFQSA